MAVSTPYLIWGLLVFSWMMVDSVDVECEAPDLPELTYGIGRCDREKCFTCHTSRLTIGDHIINHITGEIIKLDFSGNC